MSLDELVSTKNFQRCWENLELFSDQISNLFAPNFHEFAAHHIACYFIVHPCIRTTNLGTQILLSMDHRLSYAINAYPHRTSPSLITTEIICQLKKHSYFEKNCLTALANENLIRFW